MPRCRSLRRRWFRAIISLRAHHFRRTAACRSVTSWLPSAIAFADGAAAAEQPCRPTWPWSRPTPPGSSTSASPTWPGPNISASSATSRAKPERTRCKAFNNRFVPAPASIDRVTVFVLPPAGERPEPDVIGIIATSAPFRKDRLLKTMIMDQAKDLGGNVYGDENGLTALYIPSDRLFAVGPAAAIKRLTAGGRSGSGPLSPALATAAGGKPFVAAANPGVIPADVLQHAPPQLQPFVPLLSGKLITFVADFDRGTHLDVRLKYSSEQSAEDAERAAHAGLEMARQASTRAGPRLERQVESAGRAEPGPARPIARGGGRARRARRPEPGRRDPEVAADPPRRQPSCGST